MDLKRVKQETFKKYENYINPSFAKLFRETGCDKIENDTKYTSIVTLDGNKFTDCISGCGVFSIGHCHPKVIQAVTEQLRRIPLSSNMFLNKPLADLSELLAKITPGNLQFSITCNSGTEAVEKAIKLAKLYTGKNKIISTINSFHGNILNNSSGFGYSQIPFNNIKELEKEITEDTAAVILEPIQGEGGAIVPESTYLLQVRELCDERNILLILDEIQTGLGRTGSMFACEDYNVVPDIMCLGKALGGGIMPVSVAIVSSKVFLRLMPNPFLHVSTFGGNQLACTAAITTINIILEEKLPSRAKELGIYLMNGLNNLQQKFPHIISQVRGKGLLVGVETAKARISGAIICEMIKRRILVSYMLNNHKVIRVEPPLIIRKEEIDKILIAFKESLENVQKISVRV